MNLNERIATKVKILIEGYSPKYKNKIGVVEKRNKNGNLSLRMEDGTIIGIHEEYVEVVSDEPQ